MGGGWNCLKTVSNCGFGISGVEPLVSVIAEYVYIEFEYVFYL
jgi:hypothetical protein